MSLDIEIHKQTLGQDAIKKACPSCHPDHSKELNRIKRMQGQLEGVKKMIEEGRYCPEILIQTSAIAAAIRSLETQILEKHLKHCVTQAFESNDKTESDKKIKELLNLFQRRE